jgi:iron complex transport system ATP-binding protein
MAQEPGLLLLDEPTTYLDVHYQLALLDLIERWRRERNLAVVMVLHDLNLAAQYCDRLLLIRNGMMVRSGTPEEVLESDLLGEVFGVRPRVVRHPDLAVPQVLLSSRWRGADSPSVSAKG